MFLGLAAAGCNREIPPAQVGIKFNANTGLGEQIVKPQVIWVGRRERLILYPTNIRNATYTRAANEGEKAGDDSIKCSTSEGAILPVDVTVSYHVGPGNVLNRLQQLRHQRHQHDPARVHPRRPTGPSTPCRAPGQFSS